MSPNKENSPIPDRSQDEAIIEDFKEEDEDYLKTKE
jgi:hypothetical protein